MQAQRHSQKLAYFCLLVTVLGWGLTWPINKVLLTEFSPLWMLTLRMAIASTALFAFGIFSKTLALPPRGDVPIVASVALLHMVGFGALAAIGLSAVSTGRSVLLAYTVPIWVVPIAAIVLRERISSARLCAVALGLAGLIVLINPASLDWRDHWALLGNALLILAAFLWAVNIIHIRLHTWRSTPLKLAPWETLLALSVFAPIAVLFFDIPEVRWSFRLIFLLVLSGIFGTAIPFLTSSVAGRGLPAATMSLGLLATPIVSMVTSVIALGEEITLELVGAAVLIFGGIILVTFCNDGQNG